MHQVEARISTWKGHFGGGEVVLCMPRLAPRSQYSQQGAKIV